MVKGSARRLCGPPLKLIDVMPRNDITTQPEALGGLKGVLNGLNDWNDLNGSAATELRHFKPGF